MAGSDFQEWLKAMKISAAEAARLLGVQPNTITRYKREGAPKRVQLACTALLLHPQATNYDGINLANCRMRIFKDKTMNGHVDFRIALRHDTATIWEQSLTDILAEYVKWGASPHDKDFPKYLAKMAAEAKAGDPFYKNWK